MQKLEEANKKQEAIFKQYMTQMYPKLSDAGVPSVWSQCNCSRAMP